MKAIILGCGTSTGVPRIDGSWGACDPANPKNDRMRGSILVEHGNTRVLVDTSPDLRRQLLNNRINWLTGVVWTHDHADQTHGIDDLRILAYTARRRVPVYGDAFTLRRLTSKFAYCFEEMNGYPAIVEQHLIQGTFVIGDIEITPFEQDHGTMKSLGFRFGPDLAYSNDVVELDDMAFDALAGVKVWIVDAMRYAPHPTHSHLERTLEWIARVKPERAILTNLHMDMDYETLRARLPAGVEPAFDGLTIEC